MPLDGSKWSESAIPRAVELARVHDAELVLLHVYQSKAGDYAGQWALAGQQQIADQTYEQMADQLIALRNRLRQEGLRVRDVMIRGGNPAQVICDFVESEEGISMIVMSTHGRTGLIALVGRQYGADGDQKLAQPGDARPPGRLKENLLPQSTEFSKEKREQGETGRRGLKPCGYNKSRKAR